MATALVVFKNPPTDRLAGFIVSIADCRRAFNCRACPGILTLRVFGFLFAITSKVMRILMEHIEMKRRVGPTRQVLSYKHSIPFLLKISIFQEDNEKIEKW